MWKPFSIGRQSRCYSPRRGAVYEYSRSMQYARCAASAPCRSYTTYSSRPVLATSRLVSLAYVLTRDRIEGVPRRIPDWETTSFLQRPLPLACLVCDAHLREKKRCTSIDRLVTSNSYRKHSPHRMLARTERCVAPCMSVTSIYLCLRIISIKHWKFVPLI